MDESCHQQVKMSPWGVTAILAWSIVEEFVPTSTAVPHFPPESILSRI